MPINCSVYNPNAVAARHSGRSSSTRSYHSGSSGRERDTAPRTCECLTQSLACHGCGSQVGYMIVAPCARCTSTTFSPPFPFPRTPYHNGNMPFVPPPMPSSRNRATNGHRFVFHSSQVVAEERLYVSGEPGIIPDADLYDARDQDEWVPFDVNQHSPISAHRAPSSPTYVSQTNSYPVIPPMSPQSTSSRASGDSTGRRTSGHSRRSSHGPSSRSNSGLRADPGFAPFPPSSSGHQYPGSTAQTMAPAWPPKAPRIRGGEVLFWHHLIRAGELPAMYDEERSRSSFGGSIGGRSSSYDSEEDDKTRLPGVGGAVVCGR